MNILFAVAWLMGGMVYFMGWAVLHPTYLLKDTRALLGSNCTTEYRYIGHATTTIGNGIDFNAPLFEASRKCKGPPREQEQWKWVWESDDNWRDGAIAKPF